MRWKLILTCVAAVTMWSAYSPLYNRKQTRTPTASEATCDSVISKAYMTRSGRLLGESRKQSNASEPSSNAAPTTPISSGKPSKLGCRTECPHLTLDGFPLPGLAIF